MANAEGGLETVERDKVDTHATSRDTFAELLRCRKSNVISRNLISLEFRSVPGPACLPPVAGQKSEVAEVATPLTLPSLPHKLN